MMPTYLPMVRSRTGKSLGPMTSSATTASRNSLLEVISNIGYPVAHIAAPQGVAPGTGGEEPAGSATRLPEQCRIKKTRARAQRAKHGGPRPPSERQLALLACVACGSA